MPPCAEPMLAPTRSCGRPRSPPASSSASCRGRGRELRAAVHAARVAAAEQRLAVEVLDAADGGRRLAVELEHAGARNAVGKRVPERADAGADRAHHPHSRDQHPAAHALESARCRGAARRVRGVPRSWVYAGTNAGKATGVSYNYRGHHPAGVFFTFPMSTARRRRRGDRPPALGEDGLHADPTRNGLTAPEEIGAARSLVHAYRTHGHMAARLDPARQRSDRRSGARPRLPRPRRRRARAHSGRRARPLRSRARRWPTRCRACARPTPGRSRTRSSTSRAIASGSGCARRSSPAPTRSRCRPTSGATSSTGCCGSRRSSTTCTARSSARSSSRSRAST